MTQWHESWSWSSSCGKKIQWNLALYCSDDTIKRSINVPAHNTRLIFIMIKSNARGGIEGKNEWNNKITMMIHHAKKMLTSTQPLVPPPSRRRCNDVWREEMTPDRGSRANEIEPVISDLLSYTYIWKKFHEISVIFKSTNLIRDLKKKRH